MDNLNLWMQKIERCVNACRELIHAYEVEIPEKGLLAGFHEPVFNKDTYRMLFDADNMHYPLGDAFLEYGIPGILRMTEKKQPSDTEETAAYRHGIYLVYKEVHCFIQKHAAKAGQLAENENDKENRDRFLRIADICRKLTQSRPETFMEALQLFWFLYLLRGGFGGGCIGKLDQKLYPFYAGEVENHTWKREEALAAIIQFYEKLNKMSAGDTLRNLMLSGKNEEGKDDTNELTYLFLEAYERTGDAEPHLNGRIHKNTPEKLKETCIRIIAEGKGQPTLYFDDFIIPSMEHAGISHKDACRYANDGCTETVIDGRSAISFWQHEMVKTVELTFFNGEENPFVHPVEMKKNSRYGPSFIPHTGLKTGFRSGESARMSCFEDFLSAFFRQQEFQVGEWVKKIDRKIEEDENDTLTSPLVGGTFKECLITGKDPLRGGGFTIPNYQLLSGTVTTAADCLRAVEYCVFEKGYCTLDQLKAAMEADYEGYEPLRQRLLHAPKYGNGEERVDELAALIARKFLDQVAAYRSRSGKRIWPGLYNIDFKIIANITGATPDGRRFRDPIGEHCSPTPGAAQKGPTAIVESAKRLPMAEGYASSPLHLTLDKSGFVLGADSMQVIRQLMEAAEKASVPVLNISMYDREELMDAKKNPEKHRGLIVRVWGFNARFVELDEELQDHIIKRVN